MVDSGSTAEQTSNLPLLVVMCSFALGVVIEANRPAYDLTTLAALSVCWSIVPAVVVWRTSTSSNVVLLLAGFVAVVPLVLASALNMVATDDPFVRAHDGGVVATRVAAELTLDARNPYAADLSDEMGWPWNRLGSRANPVAQHYPYLPAAFLVHVPAVAGAEAVDLTWDPRLLTVGAWLVVVLLVAVAARPVHQRSAALFLLGAPFVVDFAAWGTNDALAVAALVLALFVEARRPRFAGVFVALAVSVKVLVLLPVAALVWVRWRRSGTAALRRLWTAPAVLAATVVPYLAVDAAALVEDTVRYNLGAVDDPFPASGIGLPVVWPGAWDSGAKVALVFIVVGLAVAVVAAWVRSGSHGDGIAITVAGIVLGLLLTLSRTFQVSYVGLLAALAGAGAAVCVLRGPDRSEVGGSPLPTAGY